MVSSIDLLPKQSLTQFLIYETLQNENILAIHDESGYNLLQKCVGANNVDLVRWLLARHSAADVNRFPCSLPLHIACLKGYDHRKYETKLLDI